MSLQGRQESTGARWRLIGIRATFACTGLYGAMKVYWALGGSLLLAQTPVPAEARKKLIEQDAEAITSHWQFVAVVALALVYAAAVTRPWGEWMRRMPRWILLLPAVLTFLAMTARTVLLVIGDVGVIWFDWKGTVYLAWWDLLLWSPYFLVWGLSWGLLAWGHRRAATA
ncbi:DUF3995 domain-containing protein [Streptomyces sp. NPDC048255]|uniref:DUF3995 domain-containing protein n=1 Tax=Streptomyces sp. NPDC048255 TaxID=3154713 RepID=UPI0033C06B13